MNGPTLYIKYCKGTPPTVGANVFSVTCLLKGGYHEQVTSLTYSAVTLTTVHRERSVAISERFVTPPLVTSQISREFWAVTTYQFSALSS